MVLALVGSDLKAYILEATRTDMFNMNFLIAYVIQFSSDTRITLSQGNATKIKFKQFSEFDSKTRMLKNNLY